MMMMIARTDDRNGKPEMKSPFSLMSRLCALSFVISMYISFISISLSLSFTLRLSVWSLDRLVHRLNLRSLQTPSLDPFN